LGEGVCAYIVAQGLAQASDLAAHVAQSGMAKQKIPERFEMVESLPRTASGKIRKDKLREDIALRIRQEAG
ncbi:AMP-binding enzyme, partial [Salmonella enterica]|uniref:AMP-binding enzyme n=1 Tax=Salmonella enterica TaxID=28901 RepID=UPI003CE8A72B